MSTLVNMLGLIVATIGLMLLWLQVRQVREQLTLQNYSEYTRRYSEIMLRLPETINHDEFDFEHWRRQNDFMRNMRAFFDLCFEEWDLKRRKLISHPSWSIWSGGIRTAMQRDAFRRAWAEVRDSSDYGIEFNGWMDLLAGSRR